MMCMKLPCRSCERLIGGYSVIGLWRIKREKHIRCPWCSTINVVTREDASRMVEVKTTYPSKIILEAV